MKPQTTIDKALAARNMIPACDCTIQAPLNDWIDGSQRDAEFMFSTETEEFYVEGRGYQNETTATLIGMTIREYPLGPVEYGDRAEVIALIGDEYVARLEAAMGEHIDMELSA